MNGSISSTLFSGHHLQAPLLRSSLLKYNIQQKRKSIGFCHSTQVNKKVSKVRWLRNGPPITIPDAQATEYFVKGSWGEKMNEVSLWKLSVDDGLKPDVRLLKAIDIVPSITDIASLKNDLFGFTTSTGDLYIFRLTELDSYGTNPGSFEFIGSNALHSFENSTQPCPATGIATNDASVVTVGEEGCIYEVALETNQIVCVMNNVDPLSMCSVQYVSRSELATGNMAGQVKIWDLNSESCKPVQTLNNLDMELAGAISLAQHPTQTHVLLVGLSSGSTILFDLRGGGEAGPVARLQDQEGAVSEIYFHQVSPDNFFTCSQSGQAVHWKPGSTNDAQDMVQYNDRETDLNLEFLKFGLGYERVYTSPFPINSLNLSPNNRLVCGGDSGILFTTQLGLSSTF